LRRGKAKYTLLTENGLEEGELPGGRCLFPSPQPSPPPSRPLDELLDEALRRPIGAPPLEEMIPARGRIALLVDDLTRPTPKREILPLLLERLRQKGAGPERVKVVVALGTHRPLSQEELRDALGEEVMERYPIINHDPLAQDLCPVGRLSTGTPVRVNRTVHEAALRLSIGSILPHPMAGFGGGGKGLFPGVADFDSIRDHHLFYTFQPGTSLGNLQGNPFHDEIVRMAREGRLDFIINVLYDLRQNPVGIVAGGLEAHRHGAAVVKSACAYGFSERADVTVISSHPHSEGPQALKALAAGSLLTREGGWIVLVGGPDTSFPGEMVEAASSLLQRHPRDELGRVVREKFMRGEMLLEGSIELNVALAVALFYFSMYKICLVTGTREESAQAMGFLQAQTVDEALEEISRSLPEATVHVVPAGGLAIPVREGRDGGEAQV